MPRCPLPPDVQGAAAAGRAALTGRRLLAGGDCTVVGSVGVGGSIAILLLIGFVVGAGASWLFFWLRQRRQMRIEVCAAAPVWPACAAAAGRAVKCCCEC